jgi:hypothetical protein
MGIRPGDDSARLPTQIQQRVFDQPTRELNVRSAVPDGWPMEGTRANHLGSRSAMIAAEGECALPRRCKAVHVLPLAALGALGGAGITSPASPAICVGDQLEFDGVNRHVRKCQELHNRPTVTAPPSGRFSTWPFPARGGWHGCWRTTGVRSIASAFSG